MGPPRKEQIGNALLLSMAVVYLWVTFGRPSATDHYHRGVRHYDNGR